LADIKKKKQKVQGSDEVEKLEDEEEEAQSNEPRATDKPEVDSDYEQPDSSTGDVNQTD
jgi:hypothetical protein